MRTVSRIWLLLLGVNFIFTSTYGQCENIDVNLYTQAQVDAFSTTYPGCTTFRRIQIMNSNITNLDGLSQVTNVLQNVYIDNEPVNEEDPYTLISISGLNNLHHIGGGLHLKNIPLVKGNIFENLLSVGGDISINQVMPPVLNGFHYLNTIGQRLLIHSTTLTGINGFGQLTNIGVGYDYAALSIVDNFNLNFINGFSSLSQIPGHINFLSNPELEFLPTFTLLTDEGIVMISVQNCGVSNLIGLNNITQLQRLFIALNPQLLSLEGLNGLTSVTSDMQIKLNPQLNSISNLSNLTSVSSILIEESALTSVVGLDNVNPATLNHVTLRNNPYLTTCAISPFCQKIEMGGGGIFVNTQNNGPSCNNSVEIGAACQALSIEEEVLDSISFYPNPAGDILYISSDEVTEISIYNLSGQQLKIPFIVGQQQVDMSSLPSGVYILNATTAAGTITEKIVKQ